MFCGKCGAKNEDTAKFCCSCGSELSNSVTASISGAVETVPTPIEPKKKNKKGVVIAIIAIVLVVIGIVVALFATGVFETDSKKEETNHTEQEENSEEKEEYKYRIIRIGGKEYPVAFEGKEPIFNEKLEIMCYVLDKDNELVFDENKEPQIYWVAIPNYLVINDVLYSQSYTIRAIDGWDMSDSGIMEKKGTEGKCEVHCAAVIEKGYEDASLLDWLLVRDERNAQAKPLYEAEGYKVTVEKSNVTVTNKDLPMVHYKEVIYNPDGSLANYSECLYFQLGSSDKYVIQYSCKDGVGYDENFNFIEYVNENITISKTSN